MEIRRRPQGNISKRVNAKKSSPLPFVSLPSSRARLRRDARMLLMSRARRAGRDKAMHKFENLLTIGAHDDDDGDRVAGRPTAVYLTS